MYVNPFFFGVICTFLAEIVACIVYVMIKGDGNEKH